MKADDLLDYTLGQLESPSREAVEAELARDPVLASRADRLGHALQRLLDDGDRFDPPAGLASRTIAAVADRQSRRAILDFVPARVPFRWADVAVAAGILMAGLLTLLPAVKSTREKMSQAGCGFNLQQLYSGLADYADRHTHYPKVCGKGPDAPVGWYAVALEDEHLLRDHRSLHCPCRGQCPDTGPGHIDYAYHVGFLHRDSGRVEPATPRSGQIIPILADQPMHDDKQRVLEGNSPNHGRRGQNVLFSDGHLQWLRDRRVSPFDGDLYLNEQRLPEPGLYPHDAALVPAAFRLR